METILCSLLLSAAEDTGFATSSSPWYFTTHAFFEEAQLKNSATSQVLDFNDEAAFSFGIGTLASDALTIEANYQINELSETSIDALDPINPLRTREFEYEQFGLTLGYEFKATEKLSFFPKFGVARTNWDVNIDDVVFNAAGPAINQDGTDWSWKYGFDVKYNVGDLSVFAGYMFQQGEFGPVEFDSQGLLFGASISF